jgi:uncharacterized membrane protein YvbJ
MKTCPFCHALIAKDSEFCPHCKRILIERIEIRTSGDSEDKLIDESSKQKKETFHERPKWPDDKIKIKKKFKKPLIFVVCIVILTSIIWLTLHQKPNKENKLRKDFHIVLSQKDENYIQLISATE